MNAGFCDDTGFLPVHKDLFSRWHVSENIFPKEGARETVIFLVRSLIKQIEDKDDVCSYWLINILDELLREHPEMKLQEFAELVHETIPQSVHDYKHGLHSAGLLSQKPTSKKQAKPAEEDDDDRLFK